VGQHGAATQAAGAHLGLHLSLDVAVVGAAAQICHIPVKDGWCRHRKECKVAKLACRPASQYNAATQVAYDVHLPLCSVQTAPTCPVYVGYAGNLVAFVGTAVRCGVLEPYIVAGRAGRAGAACRLWYAFCCSTCIIVCLAVAAAAAV
jgi:hypothetical protein